MHRLMRHQLCRCEATVRLAWGRLAWRRHRWCTLRKEGHKLAQGSFLRLILIDDDTCTASAIDAARVPLPTKKATRQLSCAEVYTEVVSHLLLQHYFG